MTFNVNKKQKKRNKKKNKKKTKKKLHIYKTLYKFYLMNVGITKSAKTIKGLPLLYFRFEIINSFTTFYF